MKQSNSGGRVCSAVLTTASVFVLVIVVGCIFQPKGPGRRARCINNLKNIALALLNYENKHHCFPAVGETGKDGQPSQSWRVTILPYLDRRDLYELYDPKEPWDSPKNRAIADKIPKIYRCPSDSKAKSQQTSYVMIVGPKTVGGLDDKYRGMDFICSHSGSATTLMVIEVPNSGIHWMEPRDLTIDQIIERLKDHKMAAHSGGFNVSFCDGHQQFILENIDPETLRALADPNRDKPIDETKF